MRDSIDSSAARLASNGYTHYLYIVLVFRVLPRKNETSRFPFPSFAIVNSIAVVSLAVESMISVVSFCTSSFSSSSSFDP